MNDRNKSGADFDLTSQAWETLYYLWAPIPLTLKMGYETTKDVYDLAKCVSKTVVGKDKKGTDSTSLEGTVRANSPK